MGRASDDASLGIGNVTTRLPSTCTAMDSYGMERCEVVIWVVNPFDELPGEPGRPGRYLTLSEVLARRGHEVVWWSSSFSHRFKRQRGENGHDQTLFSVRLIHTRPYQRNVSVARIINHRQFGMRFYRVARRLLENNPTFRPDRIIASVPPLSSASAAVKLGHEWNAKVIVDIQDAWPETFERLVPGTGRIHRVLARTILAPLYRQARHIYAAADAITTVAKTYVQLSGAKERNKPSHVTYLGAPFDILDGLNRESRSEGQPFAFVYLGGMSANYDLETVIRAAKLLELGSQDFRILVAGMGPREDKLKRLSEQLGVQDRIEFRGYLGYEEVVRLLGQSDCALNPVMPESCCAMPNKVADYFGAGLPVINSIPGELAELIRVNDAGAYYHAGSAKSLAAIMGEYIRRRDMVARQGASARRVGHALFRRESTYPELARFIEEL